MDSLLFECSSVGADEYVYFKLDVPATPVAAGKYAAVIIDVVVRLVFYFCSTAVSV